MDRTASDTIQEAAMRSKRKAGDQDVIDGITITRGSGNVFADIGLPNPEVLLAKSNLAFEIADRCKGMTQKQIAARLGIDQPKVSALVNGQLAQFSIDRLVTFLRRLGQDVEIHMRPSRRRRSSAKRPVLGRLSVVTDR